MPFNDTRIELGGAVWMTVGGENLAGTSRMALLAQIAQSGSITHAAKAVKMSYKAAWDAIDTMNNLAGEPLVERVTGGKGGGGTVLTRRGTQLVENFSLALTFALRYEHSPLPTVEKLDTITAVSLAYRFF